MSSSGTHARRKGTGSIRHESTRQGPRWMAYAPETGGVRERIGEFAFRHQAEEALERWLEQHRERAA